MNFWAVGESDLEVSVISVYTEITVLQGACQGGCNRTGFSLSGLDWGCAQKSQTGWSLSYRGQFEVVDAS
jgi:hypothetical protein